MVTRDEHGLAERLRHAREHAGLSQQTMADATGIPRTALSDIEHGKRKVDAFELKALAGSYGVSVDHLLGNEAGVALPDVRTPAGMVARLEQVTENLHGYLADRANELAAPHIEAAEEGAARRVNHAKREVQRANDLVDELRRQYTAVLRRAHRAEHKLGIRHTAGECGVCDTTKCEHCQTLHEHGPCNGAIKARTAFERVPDVQHYRDLLHAIWLHVPWHSVTRKLTTAQKNLWANAVDNAGDPEQRGPKAERWWECTRPGCHTPREDGYNACPHHVSLAAMED